MAEGHAARTGRNDPCPCGSGKKYKSCCMKRGAVAAPVASVASADDAGAGAGDAAALMEQAKTHFQAGRLNQARALCRQVLRQDPRHAEALAGLGQIASEGGEWEQAIRLLRQSIAVEPDQARTHLMLATQLLTAGRPEEALEAALTAHELNPSDAQALCAAATSHERLNRVDEAVAAVRRALEIDPASAVAAIELATLLRRTGELEEARRRLEPVVARDDLPGPLLERAWYALGGVRDRLREYDAAYEAFAAAGAEGMRTPYARRLDRRQWLGRMSEYRAHVTPALLARWTPETIPDDRPAPAFLVGFPRSGTTLTEQVLAAHPDIETTGEAPILAAVSRELAQIGGDPRRVPSMLPDLDRATILRLREIYREQVAAVVGPSAAAGLVIDKLPLNLIDLGLINVLFPEARVIVALRDPRDVCLSCFMQHLRLNAAMINFVSLDWATEFYAAVMAFWLEMRDRLTLAHIEVRYEDTVRDLEPQARRLVEFLGVPWHDELLDFHRKAQERSIATPSYEAVTKPVHTGAIGRWLGYRPHFEPYLERLQPYVEAFGYA